MAPSICVHDQGWLRVHRSPELTITSIDGIGAFDKISRHFGWPIAWQWSRHATIVAARIVGNWAGSHQLHALETCRSVLWHWAPLASNFHRGPHWQTEPVRCLHEGMSRTSPVVGGNAKCHFRHAAVAHKLCSAHKEALWRPPRTPVAPQTGCSGCSAFFTSFPLSQLQVWPSTRRLWPPLCNLCSGRGVGWRAWWLAHAVKEVPE